VERAVAFQRARESPILENLVERQAAKTPRLEEERNGAVGSVFLLPPLLSLASWRLGVHFYPWSTSCAPINTGRAARQVYQWRNLFRANLIRGPKSTKKFFREGWISNFAR
jgi:hypothetical protein